MEKQRDLRKFFISGFLSLFLQLIVRTTDKPPAFGVSKMRQNGRKGGKKGDRSEREEGLRGIPGDSPHSGPGGLPQIVDTVK